MNDVLEQGARLRRRLEEAKTELARLEGQQTALEDEIVSRFGVKPSEVDAEIARLEKEAVANEKRYRAILSRLEALFPQGV
jgi:chromosome segregation ATPase